MSAIETKTCPDCAEEVKAAARVCRFCGYRFVTHEVPGEDHAAPPLVANEAEAPRTPSLAAQPNWRRRLLLAGSALLWLVTLPLLATALVEDESSGLDVAASYTGAVMATLGIAAVIRVVYAFVRKRPFMSPWLFVIAAVLSVISLAGQE